MASLSILIPVYNRDCTQLVRDLHAEASGLGIPFEIIIADDCSTSLADKRQNKTLSQLPGCIVIELPSNLGRAAIRNLLADNSRYESLLFIDCDAAVCSKTFLKDYMACTGKAYVICGGLKHQDTLPKKGVELRYRYEKKADLRRKAEIRNLHPYAQFTTFSFLVDRNIFQAIRFKEFREYGYEDVLFGLELKNNRINVVHIDNPLIHLGLEENGVFLEKSRLAMKSLYSHLDTLPHDIKILKVYRCISRLRMVWVLELISETAGSAITKNLLSSRPSLALFSLYKLCVFAEASGFKRMC